MPAAVLHVCDKFGVAGSSIHGVTRNPWQLDRNTSGSSAGAGAAGAAGYAPYRTFITRSSVIGQGRRGEGEVILGTPGDRPDIESPLPAVVSFGVAAADGDEVSVTVREILEGQMSVEVVGRRSDRVAPGARIEKRWTYAQWRPGLSCPQCGRPVRNPAMCSRCHSPLRPGAKFCGKCGAPGDG